MKNHLLSVTHCLRLLCLVLGIIASIHLGALFLWPQTAISDVSIYNLTLVLIIGELLILGCAYLKISATIKHAIEQYTNLQQIKTHLEENYRLKERLLLMMNHEIRTPLTSLKGYLELIRAFSGQLSSELQEHYLDQIGHSCDETLGIVDTLTDSFQAREQREALQNVDLRELIITVLTSLTPRIQAEQRQIQLQAETLHVQVDPLRLRQVLRNLMTNAFNYSPPGTMLQITAAPWSPSQARALEVSRTAEQEHIWLSIKDQGVGISPEMQSSLFQPFTRLEQGRELAPRGSGLGLFLCRQMLEAMHGQIWIESDGIPGHGTTICLLLQTA